MLQSPQAMPALWPTLLSRFRVFVPLASGAPQNGANNSTGGKRRQIPVNEKWKIEVWYQASLIAHPFLTDDFLEEEKANLRERFLPHSQTWVKEKQGNVVGFISLIENEVGGLFVHPTWQRQGVGKALMDKASSLHATLVLDVFEANKQGRAFYAMYGFEPVKHHRDGTTGEMMIRLRYESRR